MKELSKLGLYFERPLCDTTDVMLQITKVANSSYDLHRWLWVEVTEELWNTSHDEIAKNNLTSTLSTSTLLTSTISTSTLSTSTVATSSSLTSTLLSSILRKKGPPLSDTIILVRQVWIRDSDTKASNN